MVTLINLPIFALEGLAFREFKKLIFLKQKYYENKLKSMNGEKCSESMDQDWYEKLGNIN